MAIWLFSILFLVSGTPLTSIWFWSKKNSEYRSTKRTITIFAVEICISLLALLIVLVTANDFTFFSCLFYISIIMTITKFLDWVEAYNEYFESYSLFHGSILGILALIVIIASGVYNASKPDNLNISKYEPKIEVLTTDASIALEKLVMDNNLSISAPIQRNGNWIYYINGEDYIPGYIIVTPSGEATFVEKALYYSSTNHFFRSVYWEAFNTLPGKAFWTWSTQWNPETNELYRVALFGHNKFLKAGRVAEGLIEVNMHTGQVKTYTLEALPEYLSNYSD